MSQYDVVGISYTPANSEESRVLQRQQHGHIPHANHRSYDTRHQSIIPRLVVKYFLKTEQFDELDEIILLEAFKIPEWGKIIKCAGDPGISDCVRLQIQR